MNISRTAVRGRLLFAIFGVSLLLPLFTIAPAQAAQDTFHWTSAAGMIHDNADQSPFTSIETSTSGIQIEVCGATFNSNTGSFECDTSSDHTFATTSPTMLLESTQSACQSSHQGQGALIKINGTQLNTYDFYGDILILPQYPLAASVNPSDNGGFLSLQFNNNCEPNAAGPAIITNAWPGGHLGTWTNPTTITDLTANNRTYTEKSVKNGTMTLASTDGCQLVVPNPADPNSGSDFTTATGGKATCGSSGYTLTLTNQYVDIAIVAVWSSLEGSDTPSHISSAAEVTITHVPSSVESVGIQAGDIYVRQTITNGTMLLNGPGQLTCNAQSYTPTMQIKNYPDALAATITYRVPAGDVGCTNKTAPVALGQTYNTFKDCTNNNTCTPPPGSNPTTQDSCSIPADDQLRWVDCPVADGLIGWITTVINGWIAGALTVPTTDLFTGGVPNAFNAFKDLGAATLVITALVMVVSQAADLDIFAAYTVRKVLPRLVVAAIGISLAWPLLKFVIQFFNDLGNTIGSLILSAAGTSGGHANFFDQLVAVGAIVIAVIKELGSTTKGGFLALLALFGLFVLAGLAVIAVRLLVVLICILTAPVAIAFWVLPGTEKFWRLWKDALLTTLLMFPLIMGFLAAGTAAADIANTTGNAFLKILAAFLYFIPYLLLPFAFKLAGGIMSQVVSLAEGKHKQWVGDKIAAYRKGEADWRKKQYIEGRRENARWNLPGRAATWYNRRTSTPGGFSMSRDDWGEHLRKQRTLVAQSMINKEDQGLAKYDDTGNEIAVQRGMTRDNFIRQHIIANSQNDIRRLVGGGMTWAQAENSVVNNASVARRQAAARSLAMLQTSYGAKIGTQAMQLAAWTALTQSPTSYRGASAGQTNAPVDQNGNAVLDQNGNAITNLVEGQRRMYNDAGSLVKDGIISSEQGASSIKSSPDADKRKERAGGPFGDTLAAVDDASRGPLDAQRIQTLQAKALFSTDPGAIVSGRPETMEAFIPIATQEIQQAINTNDPQRLAELMARNAAIYDTQGHLSEEKVSIWGQGMNQQQVTIAGRNMPLYQAMLALEGDVRNLPPIFRVAAPLYESRRRVYRNALLQRLAGGGQQQGQGPSDRRLKTEITYIQTLPNGIKLYSFRYIWGGPTYVGVMAQDLLKTHPDAVYTDDKGYYGVDYAMLGLRMMELGEWLRTQTGKALWCSDSAVLSSETAE